MLTIIKKYNGCKSFVSVLLLIYTFHCHFTDLGFCVAGGIMLMMAVMTLLRAFTDFWLGHWINDGDGNQVRRMQLCDSYVKKMD